LIYEKLKGAIERGDIESEAILIPFLVPTDSPLLCFFLLKPPLTNTAGGNVFGGKYIGFKIYAFFTEGRRMGHFHVGYYKNPLFTGSGLSSLLSLRSHANAVASGKGKKLSLMEINYILREMEKTLTPVQPWKTYLYSTRLVPDGFFF
jgi:hypothetical protein